MRRHLVSPVIVTLLCVSAHAHAFGEDAQKKTGATVSVSTHHLHLTRALAACAGIPASAESDPTIASEEAEIIAIYDAMTDIGTYGSSTACTAPAYALPKGPSDVGCPAGTGSARVWPKDDGASGCFTSRSGPYANIFHFPTATQLQAIKQWALGDTSTLSGEAYFAFGAQSGSIETASCYKQRAETIDTGTVRSGSAEAMGIYLHAVADSWSHKVCCDGWGSKSNPPWCTHTQTDDPHGCLASAHQYEFGCPSSEAKPFVDNTVAAASAVFDELESYAVKKGFSPHLSSFDDGGGWLRRQVERFATHIALDDSSGRIAFATDLKDACRTLTPHTCAADIPITSEVSCSYELTPQCSGSSAASTSGGSSADTGSTAGGCSIGEAPWAPASAGLLAAAIALLRRARRSR